MTTNLIFPLPVYSIECGTSLVLAQITGDMNNIVQVKAAEQNVTTTNLSIITIDGKLYSFLIHYAERTDTLNISFKKDSAKSTGKNFLHLSASNEEMKLGLRAIYIGDHILSFRFRINNYSQIDYTPTNIRFFIKDSRRAKRTAIQEIQVIPINKPFCQTIKGNKKEYFMVNFNQFTFPESKRFICQVSDKNGERLLSLIIKHKTILKARPEK